MLVLLLKFVGWVVIFKFKGYMGVDYLCFSGLGDDISSDEEEEDEEL